MSPERAAAIVPAEAVITAQQTVNHYGSAWVIIADDRRPAPDGRSVLGRPLDRPATKSAGKALDNAGDPWETTVMAMKTEHSGAKRAKGTFYGRKADERRSNKARRAADRKAAS